MKMRENILAFLAPAPPPNLGLTPLVILPARGDLMVATALDTFLTRWLVLADTLDLLSGVGGSFRGVFVVLCNFRGVTGFAPNRVS